MTTGVTFKDKRKAFLRRRRFSGLVDSPWSGGVVLVIFAVLALILANLSFTSSGYHHLLESHLTVGFDHFRLSKPLEAWINDGLMVIFFFYVGLEIRREVLVGQLSGWKRASLPMFAAVGGMVVPALIYYVINRHSGYSSGWGIAMGTDIAFALGILSLLGNRVPVSLKIFLTALAVVDDLGGILVIALFYSSEIRLGMLIAAGVVFLVMLLMQRRKVYKMRYYLILSIILWLLFLSSGIHATIAGVLIALTIPVTPRYSKQYYIHKTRSQLNAFRVHDRAGVNVLANHSQLEDIERIRCVAAGTISPSQRLEYTLHPVVSFFIMPIFALANAGVTFNGFGDLHVLLEPLGCGIFLGLVVGKPLGIFLFSRLAVGLKWCELPPGASWTSLLGVGCLGGIGFTMSIFINNLAFVNPATVSSGKISILMASLGAVVLGFVLIRSLLKPKGDIRE